MGVLDLLLSGGFFGFAASVFNRVLGMVEKRQDRNHEIELLNMQQRMRTEEQENEYRIAAENAFSAIRTASYAHDAPTGRESRWVADVRALMRPVLSLLLILAVVGILFNTTDLALEYRVTDAVLFLAITAVTWWFGDRAPNSTARLPWQK